MRLCSFRAVLVSALVALAACGSRESLRVSAEEDDSGGNRAGRRGGSGGQSSSSGGAGTSGSGGRPLGGSHGGGESGAGTTATGGSRGAEGGTGFGATGGLGPTAGFGASAGTLLGGNAGTSGFGGSSAGIGGFAGGGGAGNGGTWGGAGSGGDGGTAGATSCGNGVIDGSEECDDQNRVDTDACTNLCRNAACGDGRVWAERETCDDGNLSPGDTCSVICGSEAISIAAGQDRVCALGRNGKLQCWGHNDQGQLGAGDTFTRGDQPNEMGPQLPAVDLGMHQGVFALFSKYLTSCALLSGGIVKCWGDNRGGGLGLGDTLARGGRSSEMGDALPAVPLGLPATSVAIGAQHTCALLENGTVKCWGHGLYGQLGTGDLDNVGDEPGEVAALGPIDLGAGVTVRAIAAGAYHTCAILGDRSVKCWGYNGFGELGLGDRTTRGYLPEHMGDNLPRVELPTDLFAMKIVAGNDATCVLLSDESVRCWGENIFGVLGTGDTLHRGIAPGEMGDQLPAVDLGTGNGAQDIAAGAVHVCALLTDGSVKCWGYNAEGGLGLGDTDARGDGPGELGDSLPRVDLDGARVRALSSGLTFSCALLDDFTIKCWGSNPYGQLGLGDREDRGEEPGEMGAALPRVFLTF